MMKEKNAPKNERERKQIFQKNREKRKEREERKKGKLAIIKQKNRYKIKGRKKKRLGFNKAPNVFCT